MKIFKILLPVWMVLFLASCQVMRHAPMEEESYGRRVHELSRALMAMPSVDARAATEADQLARVAVSEGEAFAQKFGVVRPAWLNNCLVNIKLRERGLCWQYMYHLYWAIEREQPEYFTLRCAVRDQGRLFHEHHAVALSAKGESFANSLILDPWQDCGRLIWFRPSGERGEWKDNPYEARRAQRIRQNANAEGGADE
ncbi:hypothetical protein [Sulfuriroseicoccus oceanibius]|uniref:Lipoprotein n=1 Tax=Sulfuriroseicoccus oceanibius TaxID=2707525 RepID=A0A7T7JD60_9BACT|nr:hypothetical protein [Sulfuriroseicoccus oceanibius]QQL46002.1 hypothetical protein G3M56_005330 [Sulfuriroseicoccus oceanibius]